jgi:hypothetical protein
MKTRLQSLGLLDRALRAMTDDELEAAVATLDDDHREAMERIAGGPPTPDAIRAAAAKGRMDGTLESIGLVLTDAALADCIDKLGDHADNPSSDQLSAVLPGIVERHGLAVTRFMLGSTVAGEAKASNVIRDLLKHDETLKLPPVDETRLGPVARPPDSADEAVKARRLESRRRKQADARARREQAARARGRT